MTEPCTKLEIFIDLMNSYFRWVNWTLHCSLFVQGRKICSISNNEYFRSRLTLIRFIIIFYASDCLHILFVISRDFVSTYFLIENGYI